MLKGWSQERGQGTEGEGHLTPRLEKRKDDGFSRREAGRWKGSCGERALTASVFSPTKREVMPPAEAELADG